MKVKDLIAELQRFNEDDNVAVEVNAREVNAREVNDCGGDEPLFFEMDTVLPENTFRHSVKITLI